VLGVRQAATAGYLFAAAPALWVALESAQELGVLWLAGYPRAYELEQRIRELLDRINDVTEPTEG